MIAVLVFHKALNVIIFNRPKPIFNGKTRYYHSPKGCE